MAPINAIVGLITVALLSGCTGGTSDPDATTTFSKSYGGPLHDDAQVVLNTNDGGFMLFGSADGQDIESASALPNDSKDSLSGGDFWLQKLDPDGNVEISRTIGLRTPSTSGTDWRRARPTSDGGAILIGSHAIIQGLGRVNERATVSVGRDIAVSKLDSSGNTLWSVTYDSGPWPTYRYFERTGFMAAAEDWGHDVWPMADGGYLVAGISIGNLEDRSGIGFPCDDQELNELADREGYHNCDPHQSGSRFIRAYSVIVMRLNADGSLRWTRRLIDNPYDSKGNEHAQFHNLDVLIRGTADGGAVMARGISAQSVLLHRLSANGLPQWRRLLEQALPGSLTDEGSNAGPIDLIQTNDPVDGADGGYYDREADDGFALLTPSRVIKIDADGTRQWDSAIPLTGANREFTATAWRMNALGQSCEYGREPHCRVVVVGQARIEQDRSADSCGFVAFLDEDGEIYAEVYPPGTINRISPESLLRVTTIPDGTLRLLGSDQQTLTLNELPPPPALPEMVNSRRSESRLELPEKFTAEQRPDGGAIVLGRELNDHGASVGLSLQFFDAQAELQTEATLQSGVQSSDSLRAATEIAPNHFVLAGVRTAPNGESGLIALRYDLDPQAPEGGRVIWQRRYVDGSATNLDVLAAAPSGDGGVMLGLAVPSELPFPDQPAGISVSLLVKLDADGHPVRQWPFFAPIRALAAMPDGSFAVLFYRESDDVVYVSRVVPTMADPVWQTGISLLIAGAERPVVQGRITTMTATAEGGVLLAGTFGERIDLVRLAPDGTGLSSSSLRLPSGTRWPWLQNLIIRRAFDGGYVLALTEIGLLFRTATEGEPQPLGQSNVVVLKIDDDGAPLWGQAYGAALGEGVLDLAPRADGTIAVAGYSDSLGERREAWLLKLSPQGEIGSSGCQALLASFRPDELLGDGARVPSFGSSTPFSLPSRPLGEVPFSPIADTHAGTYTPQDFVTARQCHGVASAGTGATPPAATRHLTILQVGTQPGVVISDPVGISCNAGVNICAADFPVGTRVTLRADRDGFVAWRGDCDEGTGGTRLDCVILLNGDRTMQVDFGAPPEIAHFQLSVNVQGNGRVSGGRIDCRADSPGADCAEVFNIGTPVALVAQPDASNRFTGWSGDCATFGTQTHITVTVDRTLSCGAQFSPSGTDSHLVAITVTGLGTVRDANGPGIDCRAGGTSDACQENYPDGSVVTLTATADTGQRFVRWGGDCASFATSTRIDLLAAVSFVCTAEFSSPSVPR